LYKNKAYKGRKVRDKQNLKKIALFGHTLYPLSFETIFMHTKRDSVRGSFLAASHNFAIQNKQTTLIKKAKQKMNFYAPNALYFFNFSF